MDWPLSTSLVRHRGFSAASVNCKADMTQHAKPDEASAVCRRVRGSRLLPTAESRGSAASLFVKPDSVHSALAIISKVQGRKM